MIAFDSAVDCLRGGVRGLGRIETLPLLEALGRGLAADLTAVEAYPRFDNSAVDGYAVGRSSDGLAGSVLGLAGVVAAGVGSVEIPAGDCVRVLTGAPVPPNTFGVVMQEDVTVVEGKVRLETEVASGDFVRLSGSDVRVGEMLLSHGQVVTCGAVGLVASQGLSALPVFSMPAVGVITTGDELVEFATAPGEAQIRDTNQPMLISLLSGLGVRDIRVGRARDRRDELIQALSEMAESCDLILIAGGASVGDRDFVADAVSTLGELAFHGVALRPGKPVLFGSISGKPCFGLPGNPASVYVCFQLFVVEAIRRLAGWKDSGLSWMEASYGAEVRVGDRETFQRVRFYWDEGRLWARPVGEQESFGLRSLAGADGLARLRANSTVVPGTLCRVLLL